MPTVLFDLFETLVTTPHTDRPSQQAMVKELGLNLEDVRKWLKEHTREMLTGKFPTYESVLHALCTSLNVKVPESEIAALSSGRSHQKQDALHSVRSEVLACLSQLREGGWQIGVISNAHPEAVTSWSSSPLSSAVDDAVFSCEVGFMKPDPEIYTLACDRLSISPQHTPYVGDGELDELHGAALLGVRPIQAKWFRDREIEWPADGPELMVVDEIETLPSILESHASR